MNNEPPPDTPDKAPPVPRWAKVFGGVALALVLLFLSLLVVGGGHGPSRHGAPAVPPPSTHDSLATA